MTISLIYYILFLIKKTVSQLSSSDYRNIGQDEGGVVINFTYPAHILDELRDG